MWLLNLPYFFSKGDIKLFPCELNGIACVSVYGYVSKEKKALETKECVWQRQIPDLKFLNKLVFRLKVLYIRSFLCLRQWWLILIVTIETSHTFKLLSVAKNSQFYWYWLLLLEQVWDLDLWARPWCHTSVNPE